MTSPYVRTNYESILTPEQIGSLVVRPAIRETVCMQVATTVITTSSKLRIPIVVQDAAAQWIPEAAVIPESTPTVDEEVVEPVKVGTLTSISREAADDTSNPVAAELIGASVARSIAAAVDAAFWSPTAVTNGPSGIGTLAGVQSVTTDFTDVDWAVEAATKLEIVGASLSAFVCHPDTFENLAKLKKLTGSIEPLLAVDAASATKRSVNGTPIYQAVGVEPDVVWGIDRSRSFVVIREGTTLEVSKEWLWNRDALSLRCLMRVGFGFGHPASIVKVTAA